MLSEQGSTVNKICDCEKTMLAQNSRSAALYTYIYYIYSAHYIYRHVYGNSFGIDYRVQHGGVTAQDPRALQISLVFHFVYIYISEVQALYTYTYTVVCIYICIRIRILLQHPASCATKFGCVFACIII